MSTIYNRPIVTNLNHMDYIVGAYRHAGINPPTLGTDIKRKIEKVQSAATIARALAEEALTATDPDAWHSDALEKIRDAHAAELLRKEFNNVYPHIIQAAAPAYLADATEDLRAPFDKLVKAFTEAAKKLPAGESALDAEAVIVADAGAALRTVRDGLARFGTYAGIFLTPHSDNAFPADLNKILPLVELPNTVREQVGGLGNKTMNEGSLTETMAVREMATDLQKAGTDRVLVGIARGEYGKAQLSLATPETLRERAQRAATAYARQRVELPLH